MAERSVGRRATRRRSIEPGRILALGEIVNRSSADGVLASDNGPAGRGTGFRCIVAVDYDWGDPERTQWVPDHPGFGRVGTKRK
jgi:hypothetical protein